MELEGAVRAIGKDVRELQQELEVLQKKIPSSFSKVRGDIDNLRERAELLEEQLDRVEQQVFDLHEVVGKQESLRYEIKSIRKLKEEVETLKGKKLDELQFEKALVKQERAVQQVQDELQQVRVRLDTVARQAERKSADIDMLQSKIASDKALLKELQRLNKNIEDEKRFDVDRQKLEKKILEKKEEQVEYIKSVFLHVAFGVLAFAVLAYFYYRWQGLSLPGIGNNLVVAMIVLGVLAVLLFTPKGFYIALKDKFSRIPEYWRKLIDFLSGE